jgi:hypothetical protein
MVGNESDGSSKRADCRGAGAGVIAGGAGGIVTGAIVAGAIDPIGAGAFTGVIVRGADGSADGDADDPFDAAYCAGVTRGGAAVTWTAYADCAGEVLPVGVGGKLSSSEIF